MAIAQTGSPGSIDPLTPPEALCDQMRRCEREEDIQRAFSTIAAQVGFDGLSFFLLADAPAVPVLAHHWTSAGARWCSRYSERQHQAADPRILLTRNRCVPVMWSHVLAIEHPARQLFVADATRFGIRSGVALSFDDARVGRTVVAWDSAQVMDDFGRMCRLRDQLGTLALVAGFIREAMLCHCQSALANRPGTRLTPRERECVGLAARGLTSVDIGHKLGITERTVNFHFGNITTKLGVLNRSEAIVRALALRVVPPPA